MERAVPILPVDDLDQARRFYVDGLGFEVTFDVRNGDGSGLLGVKRGTIAITLDCPMSGHGREACVGLEVADADQYYEEWRRRVEVQRPPQNEEWGKRTFGLMDPFGNSIFVMGPVA